MKSVGIIGIIVVAGLLITLANANVRTLLFPPQSTNDVTIETVRSPTPTMNDTKKLVTVGNSTYAYSIIGPVDSIHVSLHSNLPDKLSSQKLKELHTCTSLTSAGFYGTNDRHIGLFMIQDEVLQEQINNDLFHAYVWKTTTGETGIGQLLPDTAIDFALQSGPLLMTNNKPRTLSMRVDEEARRIAIGTNTSSFVFYVIFDKDNVFMGPTLEALPDIIYAINAQEKLDVSTVLNLDGGNHSVFLHETTNISEFSPTGSIFCIKA